MGCVASDRKQDQCEEVEKPQHAVTITREFWMGETEATRDAYSRFAAADKSHKMPKAPFWTKMSHPVADVGWDDAAAFCGWVGGRLPTEGGMGVCGAGRKSGEIYPFQAENARDKANFEGAQGNDRYKYTAPVKSFDPNGYGLFDMAGNVWEWTAIGSAPPTIARRLRKIPKARRRKKGWPSGIIL